MKSITVLVIALVCLSIKAFAYVNFALSLSNVQECLSSNKLTIEEIKSMKSNMLHKTKNQNQKCFLKCVFNKIGVLKGNQIHKDNFYQYFGPHLGCEKTWAYYHACDHDRGSKGCSLAYELLRCLVSISHSVKRERCSTYGNPCAEKKGKHTCSYRKSLPPPRGPVYVHSPSSYPQK